MKLSVYLMLPSVTHFSSVIIAKYREGENAYIELSPSTPLDFECTAYIQPSKEKEPKWLSFLGSAFDLDEFEMKNISNSFVLLVRRNNRVFAFAFGYGYSSIDKALIESGFGLRVTLNSIQDGELDTVDTRNIDLRTRQTRTHISLSSPIYEFGINTTMDWMRYASGKPTLGEDVSRYAGSDSLQVSIDDVSITQLGEICDLFLEEWESEDYKLKFPFFDNLKRLPKESVLAVRLYGELKRLIRSRSYDRIALAHPEIPNQDIEYYKCYVGRRNIALPELSMNQFYDFLDDLDRTEDTRGIPLEDILMIGLDSEDNPKTQRKSIIEYIVCEIEVEGRRYIHSLSEWFEVATDYMNAIRERVRLLEDNSIQLPKIRTGESEGAYNTRVARELDYLLLDRQSFTFGSYRERIESCDLASRDKMLFAVKKMTSSATLSHLFAQGSVSAKLLRLNSAYASKLKMLYSEKFHESISDEHEFTFVFAIPTDKEGSITDALFFFSLVNMVDHIESIQLAGFKVALCKIDYE